MIFWVQNPINREAVAIAGECLKFLMLLQTVSKECDYEKGLIHLILESVLMIFATSGGSLSPVMPMLQSLHICLILPSLIIKVNSRRLMIYRALLLSSSHNLLKLPVQHLLSRIFFWLCLLHEDSSFRFFCFSRFI